MPQPRGRIWQVFLAIGTVKLLHVFRVRIHNQQMSRHGTLPSDWMLSKRGARFVTEPKVHARELRCYMRDPDGYLIEVGQTTMTAGPLDLYA
jgi:hypothetical protein